MANKGKKEPLTSKLASTLNTSAGDAAKQNKGCNTTCQICEENFMSGNESIFCEDKCQKFIHKRCMIVASEQFKRAGESDLRFYYLH